jgi:hypothetical protein
VNDARTIAGAWPRYPAAVDTFIVFGGQASTGRAWRQQALDFLERFFAT